MEIRWPEGIGQVPGGPCGAEVSWKNRLGLGEKYRAVDGEPEAVRGHGLLVRTLKGAPGAGTCTTPSCSACW